MSIKYTNLLPYSRTQMVRHAYFLRLAGLSIWIVALLLAAHTLLGISTYFYLHTQEINQQATLTELSKKLSTHQEQAINKELGALNNRAIFLGTLSKKPLASGAFRLVLGIPHQDIALTSISYTAPAVDKDAAMIIAGTAQTREALHTYQRALRDAAFISAVNLPLDAYTKDTNIGFTIILSGSFTP